MRAAPPGKPEDLLQRFRPQCVQGDHVSVVRQFRVAIALKALVLQWWWSFLHLVNFLAQK
jgi:hypothetical protein